MMSIFRDTFTETPPDKDLEDHVPDIGTSWTELWATTPGVGWDVESKFDTAVGHGVGAPAAGAIYTADVVYQSANYSIATTLLALVDNSIDDRPMYLFVRVQDVDNLYAVRLCNVPGSTLCRLYKKMAGVWTALGSAFDSPANGSIIELSIVGSDLEFYEDGALLASAIVTDIAIAGKAGLGIGGGIELVQPTDSIVGHQIDSFSIESILAPYVFPDCTTLWRILAMLPLLPDPSGYHRPSEPTGVLWEME